MIIQYLRSARRLPGFSFLLVTGQNAKGLCLFDNLRRVWSTSRHVFGTRAIDILRLGLFVYSNYAAIKTLVSTDCRTVLGRQMRDRPETVGILAWPYQCATWDAGTRLKRLVNH